MSEYEEEALFDPPPPAPRWVDQREGFTPSLPYAGSSGHSGTDTSKARADTEDADGTTSKRQYDILRYMRGCESEGVTWKELSERFGFHHGQASGALSTLHKDKRIVRLLQKRGKCRVYVLPDFVNGREYDEQGRARKTCPHCGETL